MKKPLKLLKRLFAKQPTNMLVSDLYQKMSSPLLVHPVIGESMMMGILNSVSNDNADLKPNLMSDDGFEQLSLMTHINVESGMGLIDISGALTSRTEYAPCSVPLVSYEAIKLDMQAMIDNPQVKTIVARFDTPGGMASNCFDLSDYIYNLRGQGTKLIAQIDDNAYSAGFLIASAFDEIQLSRTSGVGSVGVVSYHVNKSGAHEKAGLDIEFIYAGDKKVLGNSTEPLSDEARSLMQTEISRLYNMFTETVARNLSMNVQAVIDTQAGTYYGQGAIDIGFAHKLGTFDDLMTSLMNDSPMDYIPIDDLHKDDNGESKMEKALEINSSLESSNIENEMSEKQDEGTGELMIPVENLISTEIEKDIELKEKDRKDKIRSLISLSGVPDDGDTLLSMLNNSNIEINNIQATLTELSASIESIDSTSNVDAKIDVWSTAFKK